MPDRSRKKGAPNPRPQGAKGARGRRRRSTFHRPAQGEESLLSDEQLRASHEHLVQAVQILEGTLQRYAEHYDLAPVGHFTVDRTGIIREINQAACLLFCDQRPQLLGTLLRTLVEPDDRPALARHFAGAARGSCITRLRLRPRQGPPFLVELTSRRADDERECYPTTVMDLRDKGARPLDGENLIDAVQALDRRDAWARFLATVGHELRNPLGAMLAAVRALEQRAPESADTAQLTGIIRRSVEMQTRLVEDLLDSSR